MYVYGYGKEEDRARYVMLDMTNIPGNPFDVRRNHTTLMRFAELQTQVALMNNNT